MATAALARKPWSALGRILLAPARLLERTRGRKRLALLGLYCLLIVFAGVLLWRESRLAGLPEIRDPFDTASLLALEVADVRNAFVLYKEASEKAKRDEAMERRLSAGSYAWPAATDKEALAYLAANAEALATWRRGSERPDALYTPLRELTYEIRLPLVQDHRLFFRLAMFETSRLEAAGDMAGAWGWYRAALRGSRLLGRHGTIIAWLVGCAEYANASTKIAAWAADSRVDAAHLQTALADILEINALTAPNSEALQGEYVSGLRMVSDPARMFAFFKAEPWAMEEVDMKIWYYHLPGFWSARCFLDHEPERSRRIFKLMFQNWMAQCDKPPSERPRMLGTAANPRMLFDTEPPRGALRPVDLVPRIESALLAKTVSPVYASIQGAFDRNRAQRASLVIMLAEKLFERKFGKPPSSHDELIGPCLQRFPDEYVKPVDDAANSSKE
jgi:hypothetical protein